MKSSQFATRSRSQAIFGRREQVLHASLEVLGSNGSKGLTHRAVDAAAGVPPGTTSNHFPTRSALMKAALRRHVEIDTPPTRDLADVENLKLTDGQACGLVIAALESILDQASRKLLAARYELVLESTRSPELHDEFEPARESFIRLAEALVAARGCREPRRHAAQLAVVLDGILLDQLLDAASALDRDAIREVVMRQLSTC